MKKHSLRRIVSLAMALLLFAEIIVQLRPIEAMASMKTAIVTATTTLYTAKSGSTSGGTVAEGTQVGIAEKSSTRWRVYKNGQYFWVNSNYLYDTSTVKPTAASRVGQGVSTRQVIVYAQPRTGAQKIATLKPDTLRNLYSQSGNWYQIYTGGQYGWVRVDGFDYNKSVNRGRLAQVRTMKTLQTYYGPGTDYLKSIKIPSYSFLNVYKYAGNWALVYRSGKFLWAYFSKTNVDRDPKPVPVTSIYFYNDDPLYVTRGYKQTLAAKIFPSNYTDTISYKSSNTAVATVNSSGVVMGVANGTCKITIKASSGVSDTITVHVVDNIANWKPSMTVSDYPYGKPAVEPVKAYYSGSQLILNTYVFNNRNARAEYFNYITIDVYKTDGTLVATQKFTNVKLSMAPNSYRTLQFIFTSPIKTDLVGGTYIKYNYSYTYSY